MLPILATALWVCCAAGYSQLDSNKLKAIQQHWPTEKYLKVDDKNGLLEPILKVRLPGTDNSTAVQTHFQEFFQKLSGDWKISLDRFSADTPIGNQSFANFVATLDPPNKKQGNAGRLVLAAHYDSKLEPKGFIGAIDSAFPCAAVMYVAQALDKALTNKWKEQKMASRGLQVILFDGEEAFQDWTDKDSIYGARHLASKMEADSLGTNSIRKNNLDSIDTLVLLDLLGTPDPNIPSYFKETNWLHKHLASVQSRMAKNNLVQKDKEYFPRKEEFFLGGRIGDDHLPFLKRGVPILHLIPTPFPDVWHKMEDNPECLDDKTMHDWAMLMTAFSAEYFELNKYMPSPKS